MEYEYIFPRNIKNTQNIYEFICVFWNTYKSKKNSTININFKNTQWIDPNLTSVLGLVLEEIKSRNNKIFLKGLSIPLIKLLCSNEFIQSENLKKYMTVNSSLITYNTFDGENRDDFKAYINNQLTSLYKDSIDMQILIKRFIEIFINVKMHARRNTYINKYGNKEIFSSGYYNKLDNILFFSIANQGQTFKENIFKNINYNSNLESDYIAWAVKKGSSTRAEDTPGGLGLYMLNEIMQELNGDLIILSGRGYWEKSKSIVKSTDFTCKFPGSVITVKIPVKNIHNINNEIFEQSRVLTIDDLLGGH